MSTSGRPRPKTRLAIDTENAYAKLGASPLASIDEIKKILSDKRGKNDAADATRLHVVWIRRRAGAHGKWVTAPLAK